MADVDTKLETSAPRIANASVREILVASSGDSSKALMGDGSFQTPGSGGGFISGLTTNALPKATSATAIGNSSISDDGANITITEPLILTGQTSTPGSGAGTLTNAPAAGNPQTWLQVSINGVTHWIPAWHA